MPNKFNNPITGGGGKPEKPRGGKPNGKLPMKNAFNSTVPGKTGPNRNTTNVEKIKQYADSNGV